MEMVIIPESGPSVKSAALTFPGQRRTFAGSFCASKLALAVEDRGLKEVFMFGSLGPTELILILLIVIIIFGARKLPELGKSVGEGIKNFKKSMRAGEEDKDETGKKPQPPAN
jgi:sec-independent protein translocase protein TatA